MVIKQQIKQIKMGKHKELGFHLYKNRDMHDELQLTFLLGWDRLLHQNLHI